MSDDAETTAGWMLLARIVRARRKRLGLTQRDLSERGPSITTVQTVETGTSVATRTLSKLDNALAWPAGTARTIVFASDSAALAQWEDFLTYCVHEVDELHTYSMIHDVLVARQNRQNESSKESDNALFLRELRHLNMALADADYQHSALAVDYPDLSYSGSFNRLFEIIQEVRGTLRDWNDQFSQEERTDHGMDRENNSER